MKTLFKLTVKIDSKHLPLQVHQNDSPDSLALKLSQTAKAAPEQLPAFRRKIVAALQRQLQSDVSETLKQKIRQVLSNPSNFVSPIRLMQESCRTTAVQVKPFQNNQSDFKRQPSKKSLFNSTVQPPLLKEKRNKNSQDFRRQKRRLLEQLNPNRINKQEKPLKKQKRKISLPEAKLKPVQRPFNLRQVCSHDFQLCQKIQNPQLRKIIMAILNQTRGSAVASSSIEEFQTVKQRATECQTHPPYKFEKETKAVRTSQPREAPPARKDFRVQIEQIKTNSYEQHTQKQIELIRNKYDRKQNYPEPAPKPTHSTALSYNQTFLKIQDLKRRRSSQNFRRVSPRRQSPAPPTNTRKISPPKTNFCVRGENRPSSGGGGKRFNYVSGLNLIGRNSVY